MDAPSSSPSSTIYQQTPGEALKNSRKPPGISPGDSMGKTIGKLTDKSTRNPPGTTGKTPGRPSEIPPGKPFCASHPAPVRAKPAPIFPYSHMPAHLPFHFFYPSIRIPARTAKTPPSPRSWGLGAPNPSQRHRLAALSPHARRMGVRLHGAKAPRPPKRRRRQAPARGLAAVNSHRRPIRNEKKHPSPLLMGLGCVNTAPTALAGRTAAPPARGVGVRLHRAKAPRPPKTPQTASPCSWACRRQLPPPPHSERKEAPKPPTHGAWVREHSANGTGRPHCGPPTHGAWVRQPSANGWRHCRPPAHGVGVRLHRAKAPRPQTPQAASPCSWACRRLSAPPPHSERKEAPKPPTHGAWVREHRANGTGRPHCGPLLLGLGCVNPAPTACGTAAPPAHGVGVRLHGAKAPRLPKRRRRQAPARGLAAVNSHHRPIRNETQNARPLLVGRAFVYFEPTALAGRTAARRSSMRAGSSVSSISKPVS